MASREVSKMQKYRDRSIAFSEKSEEERTQELMAQDKPGIVQQLVDTEKLAVAQDKQIKALEQTQDENKPDPWKLFREDFAGDVAAHTLNEGYNWIIRWYADSHKGGRVAQINDFLQSVPQAVLGTLWYAFEMAKLKGQWPKGFKRVKLQSAHLLMNLGFSNLARVIRNRIYDSRENSLAMQAALRESLAKQAETQNELTQLRSRLEALSKGKPA